MKTRSLAAKLVEAGHVRVNGVRSIEAAKPVKSGDVLTIALQRQVRVLRVIGEGDRRGPYPEASLLFVDVAETATDIAS